MQARFTNVHILSFLPRASFGSFGVRSMGHTPNLNVFPGREEPRFDNVDVCLSFTELRRVCEVLHFFACVHQPNGSDLAAASFEGVGGSDQSVGILFGERRLHGRHVR